MSPEWLAGHRAEITLPQASSTVGELLRSGVLDGGLVDVARVLGGPSGTPLRGSRWAGRVAGMALNECQPTLGNVRHAIDDDRRNQPSPRIQSRKVACGIAGRSRPVARWGTQDDTDRHVLGSPVAGCSRSTNCILSHPDLARRP
jgi:hypothetical protein